MATPAAGSTVSPANLASPACDLPLSKPQAARKKSWARRMDQDTSQTWRGGCQIAFLLLNVWLGSEFYLWVRQYESGAAQIGWTRPAVSPSGGNTRTVPTASIF